MLYAAIIDFSAVISVALLAASACLAVVIPFDAPERRQRNRVVIACLAYTVIVAGAVTVALGLSYSGLLLAALVLLLLSGAGLTMWALATRKRRRMSASSRYYDN